MPDLENSLRHCLRHSDIIPPNYYTISPRSRQHTNRTRTGVAYADGCSRCIMRPAVDTRGLLLGRSTLLDGGQRSFCPLCSKSVREICIFINAQSQPKFFHSLLLVQFSSIKVRGEERSSVRLDVFLAMDNKWMDNMCAQWTTKSGHYPDGRPGTGYHCSAPRTHLLLCNSCSCRD